MTTPVVRVHADDEDLISVNWPKARRARKSVLAGSAFGYGNEGEVRVRLGCSNVRIALFTAGLLSIGGQATSGSERSAGDGAFAAQNGALADPRLALPSTIALALKSEIEAAATSAALEQVLLRHPDQGQLIVPRIEALGLAEIRREGPRERFVIPGLEPDEGKGNSVTLQSTADRMSLVTEFPGDAGVARFSDGSIHRFVGRFPFADILTLFGEGDKDHRLTFAILDELGMVYLRGTGRAVIAAEGQEKTIELGSR